MSGRSVGARLSSSRSGGSVQLGSSCSSSRTASSPPQARRASGSP
ncbi:hypothetical protein [Streptomyces herbicida]|nr:hypothetical protein [Streptomyces sp. NEAU-HV9]